MDAGEVSFVESRGPRLVQPGDSGLARWASNVGRRAGSRLARPRDVSVLAWDQAAPCDSLSNRMAFLGRTLDAEI